MDFVFSAGEQQFFCQRNLSNTPRRCPGCRLALRFARLGRDIAELSDVHCATCGKETKVPFKPRGHRPIYCNDCMARKRLVDELAGTSNASQHNADAGPINCGTDMPMQHHDLQLAHAPN
jgi:CxxC-x17-CxxC domain-containing protein